MLSNTLIACAVRDGVAVCAAGASSFSDQRFSNSTPGFPVSFAPKMGICRVVIPSRGFRPARTRARGRQAALVFLCDGSQSGSHHAPRFRAGWTGMLGGTSRPTNPDYNVRAERQVGILKNGEHGAASLTHSPAARKEPERYPVIDTCLLPRASPSFLVKQPGGLGYKLHSKCSKCSKCSKLPHIATAASTCTHYPDPV